MHDTSPVISLTLAGLLGDKVCVRKVFLGLTKEDNCALINKGRGSLYP